MARESGPTRGLRRSGSHALRVLPGAILAGSAREWLRERDAAGVLRAGAILAACSAPAAGGYAGATILRRPRS